MSEDVQLRRIAKFAYGDALAAGVRRDGSIPVVSSGGVTGSHAEANVRGPSIVVGRKGSFGSVHWMDEDCFVIDTAYSVVPANPDIHIRWLYYRLLATDLRGLSQDVGVPGLSRESAYITRVMPPPSYAEQQRIAGFLDTETARIDRLVAMRRRQLPMLEERFGEAVGCLFKDFRSARPTRLKYLTRQRPRYGVLVPTFVDEGVPFVRVNDLLDLASRIDGLRRIPLELSQQYSRTVVKERDILLSVVGTLGRTVVAPRELIGANIARAVSSLRVRAGVDPYLLAAWTATRSFREQALTATSTDTAQPTLGMEDLANFRLVWPGDTREQRDGVVALSEIRTASETLQSAIQRQVAVLVERRQALITAAVTGQFDVTTARGADLS